MNKGSLKILMLHSSSDLYGGSRILLLTAGILKDEGCTVIVALSEEGPLADELRNINIDVRIVKLGILRRKYFTPSGILNRIRVLVKAYIYLSAICRDDKVDIIYSNTAAVLVGGVLAAKQNLPHLWHIHEIIPEPAFFSKFISRYINNYSSKVVVVSNEVKKFWTRHLKAEKMKTIHNGLDYDPFLRLNAGFREGLGIKDNEVLIGMIGRVNLWKGQMYFLQIASFLRKKYPFVRFIMIGDAYPGFEYLESEINKYISDQGLDDVIYNLGFRTDVPHVLHGLDIFVLPSIKPDPLPTVVLEAMASSKPVVAVAHGGSLEMVENEKTGILIPWDDAELASEHFYSLIENAGLRKAMGEKGKDRALRNFSYSSYKNNITAAIRSL